MTEIEQQVKEIELSQEAMKISIQIATKESAMCHLGIYIFLASGILIFGLANVGPTKAMACIMCIVGVVVAFIRRENANDRAFHFLKKIE